MDIPKEEMTATVYSDDLRYFNHYCKKNNISEANAFSEMTDLLDEQIVMEPETDLEECFNMIQLLIRYIHRIRMKD